MRYLDWDVLLFPSQQDGGHVPLKEFRTACYAEHYDNAGSVTPLLTTFVPTLPAGKPFQISLHSWSDTGSILTLNNTTSTSNASKPKELWQVRVVIDDSLVCTESFDIDATWPQIISSTTTTADQVADPLRFPLFHRDIAVQNYWQASDQIGRIRVELSTGYVDPKSKRFVKAINLVNFAFQPAPMDLLEHSGIAWPNPHLLRNPLASHGYFRAPLVGGIAAMPKKHMRATSANPNFTVAPTALMMPTINRPLNPFTHEPNSNYDAGSRSTSAYSTFTDSAAPILTKMPAAPPYPLDSAESARKHQQISWRLPSDQLQLILNAIHPTPVAAPDASVSSNMPPPPLPAHTTMARFSNAAPMPLLPTTDPPLGQDNSNIANRRQESSYSDVSMHAGCTGFPLCTSEDDEGHILHNAPVVRGRKEGSSPTKPRDFFNTILDTTASAPANVAMSTPAKEAGMLSSSPADSRKRTRSALRSLNINDGSPEKNEVTKVRKASKGSIASSKSGKENHMDATGDQENMLLDA